MRCRRCVPSHDQVGFPHRHRHRHRHLRCWGRQCQCGCAARDVAVCLLPAADEIPQGTVGRVAADKNAPPSADQGPRPMRVIFSAEKLRGPHVLGGALRPRDVGSTSQSPRDPVGHPSAAASLTTPPRRLAVAARGVAARDFESNSTRGQTTAAACPRIIKCAAWPRLALYPTTG